MTLDEWMDALPDGHRARKEIDSLRSRLAAAEADAKRLDWIETHLIEGKWDGTIGRPKSWHMVGPYRHTLQKLSGNTLRDAIDANLSAATSANSPQVSSELTQADQPDAAK